MKAIHQFPEQLEEATRKRDTPMSEMQVAIVIGLMKCITTPIIPVTPMTTSKSDARMMAPCISSIRLFHALPPLDVAFTDSFAELVDDSRSAQHTQEISSSVGYCYLI